MMVAPSPIRASLWRRSPSSSCWCRRQQTTGERGCRCGGGGSSSSSTYQPLGHSYQPLLRISNLSGSVLLPAYGWLEVRCRRGPALPVMPPSSSLMSLFCAAELCFCCPRRVDLQLPAQSRLPRKAGSHITVLRRAAASHLSTLHPPGLFVQGTDLRGDPFKTTVSVQLSPLFGALTLLFRVLAGAGRLHTAA